MQETDIYVVKEQLTTPAYWTEQAMDGIRARAAYRKATVRMLEACHIDRFDASNDPVIVLGASLQWVNRVYALLSARGIRSILLGANEQMLRRGSSNIVLSYAEATEEVVEYLVHAGRRRIAFVAFNPASPTDKLKHIGLKAITQRLSLRFGQEDIFALHGGLDECVAEFVCRCAPYDAVLCANDVSGIMLIRSQALQKIKRIPEDLYVVSFGDTVLSKLVSPSLTSVTLDYFGIGDYAVDNVFSLRRRKAISSQFTALHSQLVVGASTEHRRPFAREAAEKAPEPPVSPAEKTFYSDPSTAEILTIESFFSAIDVIDMRILLAYLRGMRSLEIGDSLFISGSTLKYRMRKMLQITGDVDREALLARILQFVDPAMLEAHIRHLENRAE